MLTVKRAALVSVSSLFLLLFLHHPPAIIPINLCGYLKSNLRLIPQQLHQPAQSLQTSCASFKPTLTPTPFL